MVRRRVAGVAASLLLAAPAFGLGMAGAPGVAVAAGGSTPSVTATAAPTATAAATPTATVPGAGASTVNPFSGGVSPLAPASTTTSTTPTIVNPTTAAPGTSSLSSADAVIVALGAVALIGGIGYFIWRDARRRAPVRADGPGVAGEGRRAGSKPPPKPRKLSPAERRRRKRGRARR